VAKLDTNVPRARTVVLRRHVRLNGSNLPSRDIDRSLERTDEADTQMPKIAI
jgi:hypothetical protein